MTTTVTRPVAVITGGAQGIGGAAATALVKSGWVVHSLDIKDNPLDEVADHYCDVTDEGQIQSLAEKIGPIDALIPAAGVNLRPDDFRAETLKIEAWNKTLAINLTGVMLAVRHFRPKMRHDGSIVLISSVAGLRAMPLADAYTASKGALIALARSWSVDYGRFGIRVNCLCPGPVETEMMAGMREQFAEKQQLQLPQQRMARPEEIGATIEFLVSPGSTYISGAIIPVDGGATAHSAGMPFPKRRTE